MEKLKPASVLALLALASNGFAIERGANGGNVGVCFSNSEVVKTIRSNGNMIANSQLKFITSVTSLDQYEARSKHDDQNPDKFLALSKEGEGADDYALRLIKRLDFVPELVPILSEKLEIIKNDRTYYNDGGLDRIYDTNEAYYLDPERCVVATAIHQSTFNGGGVKLEFDNRLYSFKKGTQTSRDTQGILMLHETVLRWALDLGHKNSKSARELTALIIQKRLSRDLVIKKLSELGFLGLIVPKDKPGYTCYSDKLIGTIIVAPDKTTKDGPCINRNSGPAPVIARHLIDFGNGNVKLLNGLGETAESNITRRAMTEIIDFDLTKYLPRNFLKDLLRYGAFESTASFSHVFQAYQYLSKDETPYCKATKIAPDQITTLEEKIIVRQREEESLKTEINILNEKLGNTNSRAMKKKIEQERDHLWTLRRPLIKEIQTLRTELDSTKSNYANWTECQEGFLMVKKEYLKQIESLVRTYDTKIEANVNNKIVMVKNNQWISDENKNLIIETIQVCKEAIMRDGDFVKSCIRFKTDFANSWEENPEIYE